MKSKTNGWEQINSQYSSSRISSCIKILVPVFRNTPRANDIRDRTVTTRNRGSYQHCKRCLIHYEERNFSCPKRWLRVGWNVMHLEQHLGCFFFYLRECVGNALGILWGTSWELIGNRGDVFCILLLYIIKFYRYIILYIIQIHCRDTT
jgi:hypothetical protein